MTVLSMLPLSIPSPPLSWASFTIPLFGLHLTVRTYALCILAGIIVAAAWSSRRLSKRGAEPGVILDIVLWAVPLGIIVARFWHVFTHPHDYFYPGANLLNVFYIWDGGNAIFGAILGGAVGAFIACRIAGLRFWVFADALAPAMLVAQAIGRLGNYANNELFGLPTNLPWGLQISSGNPAFPAGLPSGTLFQPLFLYEIIWDVLGAVVIVAIERRHAMHWGIGIGFYGLWYGAGRSFLEMIRIDPSEYSFLSIPFNAWAAILAAVLGIVIMAVQHRRHPGAEPGAYLPGREWIGKHTLPDSKQNDWEEGTEPLGPLPIADDDQQHITSGA
ncbi:MAG TPA: prolipoprotein diacylglyceryl transferase [Microbacteriaceae bacterium]|nr:prolipoprotein diacylglyceryl transferase [Microbacteriaceae bacterium]